MTDTEKVLKVAKSLNKREYFADSLLGLEAFISFDEIIYRLESLSALACGCDQCIELINTGDMVKK